jgi:putative flippase GtrA
MKAQETMPRNAVQNWMARLQLDRLPLAKLIRFAFVGFGIMAIHIALGFLMLRVFRFGAIEGSLLTYLASASIGYVLQRIITFRSFTPHGSSVPRFAVMILLGVIVSLAAAMLARLLAYDPIFGIILAGLLMPAVNYVIMDRLVFPDQR